MTEISERYPDSQFKHVQNHEELLLDPAIQAVSICTDHASHEGIILEAIAHGKHLICEKPLTTQTDSLQRICAAAESTSCITAGVFQHRFDPIYRELKALLSEGGIGKVMAISVQHQCFRGEHYYKSSSWRGTQAGEGGSLLINQSIHFLDILQWISGGVQSVSAHVANLGHPGIIETEDTAAVSLQLNNGALATFTATTCSHKDWDSAFSIVGSDGEIKIRNGKLESCSHRDTESADRLGKRLTELEEIKGVEGAKAYYGTSHPAQIRDFIQAIRGNRKPFVSLTDAAETNELVLAIYRSAKSGSVERLADNS